MNVIVAQHITFCNTGFYALNQSRNTSEFYLNTDFPFNSVKKPNHMLLDHSKHL